METPSVLLITDPSWVDPTCAPVIRSFNVFFGLNKLIKKNWFAGDLRRQDAPVNDVTVMTCTYCAEDNLIFFAMPPFLLYCINLHMNQNFCILRKLFRSGKIYFTEFCAGRLSKDHLYPFFFIKRILIRCIMTSLEDSPHKGQWRGTLVFSLVCAWANGWANNRDAGDLRRHRPHYDLTVMFRILKGMPHLTVCCLTSSGFLHRLQFDGAIFQKHFIMEDIQNDICIIDVCYWNVEKPIDVMIPNLLSFAEPKVAHSSYCYVFAWLWDFVIKRI